MVRYYLFPLKPMEMAKGSERISLELSRMVYMIGGGAIQPRLFHNMVLFLGHSNSQSKANLPQVYVPMTRFWAICRAGFTICEIMENIQKLLDALSGLIEQKNVLGIPNIRRCAGGVHDYSTTITASSWVVVRVIVVFGFSLFFLTLLRVPDDHLINLTKHFRCQPLAEVHHQRWVKGQLFIIIVGVPTEVLRVQVLLDLKCSLLIKIAILRLGNTGSQSQLLRLGHIAFVVGKQSGIPLLDLQPWNRLGFLHPTVAFL